MTNSGLLQVPPELLSRYAEWLWSSISVYPGNSTMHRLVDGQGSILYLKVVRNGWSPTAEAEAERTIWADAYLPVPKVLASGATDEIGWVLTQGVDGLDATSVVFRHDVPGLVDRLATGLRRFHEAPTDACPFKFGLEDALRLAEWRLDKGLIDPRRDFHPEHAHLTAEAAVEELRCDMPGSEDIVVCHGDYCVPNILLRDDVVGYVDLGGLGVADRWWDLAVATWSLDWNFGPGYESRFLAAYGIESDTHRIRYYRLLYDVVS